MPTQIQQLVLWPEYIRPNILQYVAGLIDGEGSFQVGYNWQGKYRVFAPRITCTSNTKGVLDLLLELFGGGVHVATKAGPNRKTGYVWAITGRSSAVFAKLLLPYLLIKRLNAENLIDFEQVRAGYNYRQRHSWPHGYTRDERYSLLTFVTRSKELNH